MPVKVYKPTTPGRRQASVLDFSDITATRPVKSLVRVKKRHAGRNNAGQITVRHRGGGAKRMYRLVDFRLMKLDVPAAVKSVEYDPNRSARIGLIEYADGELSYVVLPLSVKVGDKIVSSNNAVEATPGSRLPLKFIPVGLFVYNIELEPGKGGQLVRSAGTGAQLQTIESGYAQLKLPSGEVRLVPELCRATVGQISNPDHKLVRLGKAGRKRHLGWRPTVTGKAMNPVDHPHGGGEGHNPIGLKDGPKTKWGKPALGVKTRDPKKWTSKLILHRRPSKSK